MENALSFSYSLKNRIALADAYVNYNRYEESIVLYRNSLTGFMAEDPELRMKLLYSYFLNKSYSEVIALGRMLESEKSFKNATQRLAYAWALHYGGYTPEAENIFADMDKPFTNYTHRLEYCKFLDNRNEQEKLKMKITALMEEFEHIRGAERKLYSNIIRETRDLYTTHVVGK